MKLEYILLKLDNLITSNIIIIPYNNTERSMSTLSEKIINEASQLTPMEKAEIIDRIIESFDNEPDEGIKKAWAEEAEHRLALHKKKDSEPIPEDEVFKNL